MTPSKHQQPGNPKLARALTGRSIDEVSSVCDTILARPMPDHVMEHLLDDLLVYFERSKDWTCERWGRVGLPCPHEEAA